MAGPYITTGEAARALGVGHVTLLRWAHAGKVTPALVTPGRQLRWDLDDLRRQLAAETTGDLMPDPYAPLHPSIAAAVVTSKEGVLVERRHDGRPLWTLPAGEIEPGESPADCVVRETKEECGLQVVVSHAIGERDHPKTGRHMIYLACRPYQGTAVHNGDEAELAEVAWVDYDTAIERLTGLFPPVREHLARTLKP